MSVINVVRLQSSRTRAYKVKHSLCLPGVVLKRLELESKKDWPFILITTWLSVLERVRLKTLCRFAFISVQYVCLQGAYLVGRYINISHRGKEVVSKNSGWTGCSEIQIIWTTVAYWRVMIFTKQHFCPPVWHFSLTLCICVPVTQPAYTFFFSGSVWGNPSTCSQCWSPPWRRGVWLWWLLCQHR